MTSETGFKRICTMFTVENKRAKRAYTGYIPIKFFEKYESTIREYIRESLGSDYRIYFKGPRPKGFPRPCCTLRKDATHAMVYPRHKKIHFDWMDDLYNASKEG